MTSALPPPRPSTYDKKVALVLQGGGALGSYQAGVYEALAASEYVPDWVAGISIGSINSALIAGNPRAARVARLRQFWETVTSVHTRFPFWGLTSVNGAQRQLVTMSAVLTGQPGFFAPHPFLHWLPPSQPTSYYDTSALKSTLERLVDFDRINAKETRFSVGAVNVRTGRLTYFDNASICIRPEHAES